MSCHYIYVPNLTKTCQNLPCFYQNMCIITVTYFFAYVLKKFWCRIPEDWILSFPIVTIVVLHLCLDLQSGPFLSNFRINYFFVLYLLLLFSIYVLVCRHGHAHCKNSAIGTPVNVIVPIIQPSLDNRYLSFWLIYR